MDASLQTVPDELHDTSKSTRTFSEACQTELIEYSNVTTETESDLQGVAADDAGVPNGADDSYLRVST